MNITHNVAQQCLELFFKLRDVPRIRKRPSTSELIDWIFALRKAGVDLARVGGGIPFLGTLLKNEQDIAVLGNN